MQQFASYLVTCLNCKGHAQIRILEGNQVMYIDHTPIIACRFRPDMKWGFECTCGNDTRLAPQEKKSADLLISGADKNVIKRIVAAATETPERQFKMETT